MQTLQLHGITGIKKAKLMLGSLRYVLQEIINVKYTQLQ